MAAGKHTVSSVRRNQTQAARSAGTKTSSKARSGGSHRTGGTSSRSKKTQKAQKARTGRGGQIAGILITVLLLGLCAGAVWYGVREGNRYIAGDRIYPNVSVGGISVGGLTREQGTRALRAAGYESADTFTVRVVLTQDTELVLRSDEIDYGRSAVSASRLAWEYGRNLSTSWDRLYALASCWVKPVSLAGENANTFNDNAVLDAIRSACAAANIDGVESATWCCLKRR